MRKKLYVLLASVLVIHFLFVFATGKKSDAATTEPGPINDPKTVVVDSAVVSDDVVKSTVSLYQSLNLDHLGLNLQAFEYALRGYNQLLSEGKLHNEKLLSIVDFSLPSSRKRLFVIDLENNKVVYHTYVSHGRNSGKEMAHEFSNQPESNKSSLGFYVTGGTYIGKHGYSLRLLGEEKGINDNALSRAIVMHSAAYVSEAAIKMQGFIGRSLGCPALPENLHRPIIEKIKNGSCLFLYSPDKNYAAHSRIVKKVA